MELKEILSVSGKPGLYKKVGSTKTGLIAESLIDKKRIPVYASDKMSTLQDISIFTTENEISLKEVFKSIHVKENGGKCIDHKSDDKKLREYFEQILPTYDKDRVYISDIRKVFNWYNLLVTNDMLDLTDKPEESVEEEKKEGDDSIENPKKTIKKTAEKKPAAVKSAKDKKPTK